MRPNPCILAPTLLLLAVLFSACAPADPVARVLEERARWKVEPISWAIVEDGSINLSARISGPVRSELETLTFRIELLDATEDMIDHEWRTVDLAGFERGVSQELMFSLAAREATVDGLRIDPVYDPTPEESRQIKEIPSP